MVNAAIVEDEIRSADVLCGFLERYGSEKGREFAVSRFTDAIAFLENYVPRYDIVFMDIQLPDMDGMTASRRLRALDRDVILIFVTNMANYAVSGYEVDALDFIVKPVSYFPFTVKLERALGRLDGNAGGGSVLLSTAEGAVCVRPCDVRYVEVMKHTLIYHTTTGDLTVYGSRKNAESTLPADRVRAVQQLLSRQSPIRQARDGVYRAGGRGRAGHQSFQAQGLFARAGRVHREGCRPCMS